MMRKSRREGVGIALALAGVLAVSACVDGTPADPTSTLSPQAALYLDAAVTIMEDWSIRRHEIDWAEFRATTFDEAEAVSAQSAEDTYPMIVAALQRIGDNHSFFQPPASALSTVRMELAAQDPPQTADPMSELLEPGVGYLDVPAFSGGGSAGDELALSYHELIESVDTIESVCRWVVDLRGNTGGNMWPMIAGVGPILGPDTVGMFVDPDSSVNHWFYDGDGGSGLDNGVIASADPPYVLAQPLPNVAVLHDSLTASSGEAVAIAFRGRPGARSFGTPTWGVSTANQGFELSDGAVIFLTVSTMADREGSLYGQRVTPDEVVAGSKTGDRDTDAALDAAVTWLNAQGCA